MAAVFNQRAKRRNLKSDHLGSEKAQPCLHGVLRASWVGASGRESGQ